MSERDARNTADFVRDLPGIRVVYSPVNMAWFVLWNAHVLRVFNSKAEAYDYVRETWE